MPVDVPRIPDRRLAGLCSEYALTNVGWEHYNTLYRLLDYANHWPPGMAAHVAWPSEGVGRAIYLWDSRESMERYFATVVADRIATAIRMVGAVQGPDGAVDIEPVLSPAHAFVLGPRARDFSEIGADVEGDAVRVLGGTPALVRIDFGDFDADMSRHLEDALGFARRVPAGLILRTAIDRGGYWVIFELWRTAGEAEASFHEMTRPAAECLSRSEGAELIPRLTIEEPSRIVIDAAAVEAFGF